MRNICSAAAYVTLYSLHLGTRPAQTLGKLLMGKFAAAAANVFPLLRNVASAGGDLEADAEAAEMLLSGLKRAVDMKCGLQFISPCNACASYALLCRL